MTPRGIAALALGLTAIVFAPLSAQAAPSDAQVEPKPFDIRVTAMTFHPMRQDAFFAPLADTLTCFDGQRLFVKVEISHSGSAPEYTGAREDGPHIRLSGRPVDGHPDEVAEVSLTLPYAANTDLEWTRTYGGEPTVPPSFVGRDMVWSATISHPQDQTPENHVLENVILPACTG